ncbi:MAG: hypothetical protein ACYDAG_11565 [Chloroflexota bacterium]
MMGMRLPLAAALLGAAALADAVLGEAALGDAALGEAALAFGDPLLLALELGVADPHAASTSAPMSNAAAPPNSRGLPRVRPSPRKVRNVSGAGGAAGRGAPTPLRMRSPA